VADSLKRWERTRKAYKKLPLPVRIFLSGLAFILGPLGVVAMFTPLAVLEVGSILVFTSLAILSFEFDWASNLLSLLRQKLQHKSFRRKLTLLTAVVVVTYAVIIAVKLIAK
jgi:Putative transmembrane protein (PGPGW)